MRFGGDTAICGRRILEAILGTDLHFTGVSSLDKSPATGSTSGAIFGGSVRLANPWGLRLRKDFWRRICVGCSVATNSAAASGPATGDDRNELSCVFSPYQRSTGYRPCPYAALRSVKSLASSMFELTVEAGCSLTTRSG